METDDTEEDSTVSSSSSGKGNSLSAVANETAGEAEAECSGIEKVTTNGECCSSPDSSLEKDSERNGVSCSETNKVSKPIEGVTSSSSPLSKSNDTTVSGSNDLSPRQINGEVSSPSAVNSASVTSKNCHSTIISSSTSSKLFNKPFNLESIMDDDDDDGDDDDSSTDSDVDFQGTFILVFFLVLNVIILCYS